MKISVITINYKTPKLTTECIDSIFEHSEGVDFEIILVDNGSGSESKKYFQEKLHPRPNLKIIYSPNNLGFGGGNNLGAANATGELLFFLNNDTFFFENSLKILHDEFLEKSKKTKLGILQPRLYLNQERTIVQKTCSKTPKTREAPLVTIPTLRKIFKSKNQKFYLTNRDRNSDREVEVVCGAAMLIKTNTFEEIGKFDERFFLYFEEFDLAKRLNLKNYKSFYTTKTSIIHFENQTPKITRKKKLMSLKSLQEFIKKYAQ